MRFTGIDNFDRLSYARFHIYSLTFLEKMLFANWNEMQITDLRESLENDYKHIQILLNTGIKVYK